MEHLLADVSATPTAAGMPGGDVAQQLINWLCQIALWGGLASILLGGALYGLAEHGGHYGGAAKGRKLAVGGGIGALMAGLAPQAINVLYRMAAGS